MITREEYLKALETIDLYHRQNDKKEQEIIASKTDLLEWITQNHHRFETKAGGTRFFNAIKWHYDYCKRNNITEPMYFEDINWFMFKKQMNAGIKTWNEFVKIRGY